MKIPRTMLLATALAFLAFGADAAPIALSLDFNDDDAAGGTTNTQPGFTGFALTNSGSVVDGVSVSISGVGSPGLDDRLRTTPTNSGNLTFAAIYQDFIFQAQNTNIGTDGIDVLLSGAGLTPFQQYKITIYAFDSGSSTPADGSGTRKADWTANGTFLLATAFENFGGINAGNPTSDDQYAFTGFGTADSNGALLLSGRRMGGKIPSGTGGPGVFLNALVVSAVPEPSCGLLLTSGLLAFRGARRRR